MADRSFILIATSAGWRIGTWPMASDSVIEIAIPAGTTPAETAAKVSLALIAAGYNGKPVAIGVASVACLSASISVADLPKNDPKAMAYRLEEHLPLAAETVVADFILRKQAALGVCLRLETIAPIVTAFEAANIPVQSIFPTALATVQGAIGLPPNCVVLCGETGSADAGSINVIALQDGVPTHWALVPATAADLKLQLDLLSTELGSIPHIQSIDLNAKLINESVEITAHMIDAGQGDSLQATTRFAADVLRGRAKPWVEFRRGPLAIADPLRLHRRWIDATLAAAVALLLSLTLVFLMRAHRYRLADQASRDETVAAFHEHFPGWETPANVRLIVDAQYRQATAAGAPAGRDQASALVTLHDVLVPLMTEEHVQISRMAFHENAFEITGRVQSYEQLDALSKLARVNGMIVTPGQSHKEADGTWTFVLNGSRPVTAGAN